MELVIRGADLEVEAGDRLTRLYVEHAPAARRFAFLVCGDRQRAEDAVQESFLRIFGRFGDLRSEAAFPHYLRRTIVNVLHTQARREGRDLDRAVVHERLAVRSAPDVAMGHDDALWAALQDLPERQRVALVCRYWLDLTEADTASALGCRRGTVKSLLARGLSALREVMERE